MPQGFSDIVKEWLTLLLTKTSITEAKIDETEIEATQLNGEKTKIKYADLKGNESKYAYIDNNPIIELSKKYTIDTIWDDITNKIESDDKWKPLIEQYKDSYQALKNNLKIEIQNIGEGMRKLFEVIETTQKILDNSRTENTGLKRQLDKSKLEVYIAIINLRLSDVSRDIISIAFSKLTDFEKERLGDKKKIDELSEEALKKLKQTIEEEIKQASEEVGEPANKRARSTSPTPNNS